MRRYRNRGRSHLCSSPVTIMGAATATPPISQTIWECRCRSAEERPPNDGEDDCHGYSPARSAVGVVRFEGGTLPELRQIYHGRSRWVLAGSNCAWMTTNDDDGDG
ncbi:hypothetical protein ACLOJK_008649 [Asimina triloba]